MLFLAAHSHLAQQYVTASMLLAFEQRLTIDQLLTRELNLNSQSQFFKASLHVFFPFGWESGQEYMPKYHLLLSEFLGDPRRSKEFYIDGDKFTTLATTLAKYIFTPYMYVSLFLTSFKPY